MYVCARKVTVISRSFWGILIYWWLCIFFMDVCARKVTVMEHEEATLRQMLEYIYTNRVKDMPGLSADEVIKLLALANGKIYRTDRQRQRQADISHAILPRHGSARQSLCPGCEV